MTTLLLLRTTKLHKGVNSVTIAVQIEHLANEPD